MTTFRYLLILVPLLACTGCVATWPNAYGGLPANDITQRHDDICAGLPRGADCPFPMPCFRVQRYVAGIHQMSILAPLFGESPQEIWQSCIDQLAIVKTLADKQRSEYAAEKEAERLAREEAIRKDNEQRARDLAQYGPYFVDLYALAYQRGADAANQVLAEHDNKVRFNDGMILKSCTGNICIIGSVTDGMHMTRGMKGFGFDMIARGVYAEPGTSIWNFDLVRFEEYGAGVYNNPVAVFTRK